jgi:cell division protein FtsB
MLGSSDQKRPSQDVLPAGQRWTGTFHGLSAKRGGGMNRTPKVDATLDKLNDERDHINIQISLLNDGPQSDPARMQRLQRTVEDLEQRIAKHSPGPA